jgi:putative flippase GtrA
VTISSIMNSDSVRWQAIRYLLVAGTTSLFYLGLIAGGLALGIQYFIAILCAQFITVFSAFPAYRAWVFKSRTTVRHDFVRFLGVWSTGAIAGLVATPIMVELLHLNALVAQVIAIAVLSVFSFLGHRYISFRKTRGSAQTSSLIQPGAERDAS